MSRASPWSNSHLRCSTLASALRNLLTITVQAPHPELCFKNASTNEPLLGQMLSFELLAFGNKFSGIVMSLLRTHFKCF